MAEIDKPESIIHSETHQTVENYDHLYFLSNSSRTDGVIIYFKKHWRGKKLKKILKTINCTLDYCIYGEI